MLVVGMLIVVLMVGLKLAFRDGSRGVGIGVLLGLALLCAVLWIGRVPLI